MIFIPLWEFEETRNIYNLSKKYRLVILNSNFPHFSFKIKIPLSEIKTQIVKIQFHNLYPFKPPIIWFYDDENLKFISDYQWTTHQNSDGTICIWTDDFGPDSWFFTYNINKTIKKIILFLEKCLNRTITDDHTSIYHPLPGKPKRRKLIYISNVEFKNISTMGDFGNLFLFEFKDKRASYVLFTRSDINIENLGLPWNLLEPNPIYKGIFLKTGFSIKNFRQRIKQEDNHNIVQIFRNLNPLLTNILKDDFIFPIFSDSQIISTEIINPSEYSSHLSYLYLLKNGKDENINHFPLYFVHGVNIMTDILQRTYSNMEPVIQEIKNKTVMIIGVGSLGSTIALELVKSGIKKFIVIDFDILQPVNICRHTGDISDIGSFKTTVIKRQIEKINPLAEVIDVSWNPFENSSIDEFYKLIQIPDLIINTTANHNASILLNKFALEVGKTTIYCICGENADVGRVFRVIPNQTPCYVCVNTQLLDERLENFRILPSKKENLEYQFAGYNQPGIPGISININFVALFCARFSLGTLFMKDNLFPEGKYNHFLWQNTPKKTLSPNRIFDLIYQEHFQKLHDCKFCGIKQKFLSSRKATKKNQQLEKMKKSLLSKNKEKEFWE